MVDTMQPKPFPSEPGILAFHKRCEEFYPADGVDVLIEQQRRWYDALCAEFDAPSPEGLTRQDELVGGRIPVRRYRPVEIATQTRILYIHGGGCVVGSLESHDAICAEIAHAAKAELVSVDYRLAPEHVWPAAFDDCFEVLTWLLADGRPLVVAGDSAGGNLAAGIALKAKAEAVGGIVGQVLIYPGLGGDLKSGSYAEMAEAPGLSTADVRHYRDVLKAPPENAFAHPLKADDLSGLPSAYITSAHFDPLRDDAAVYAERLFAAGVNVTYRDEPQMIHAWMRARFMSEGAQEGFRQICLGVRGFVGTL